MCCSIVIYADKLHRLMLLRERIWILKKGGFLTGQSVVCQRHQSWVTKASNVLCRVQKSFFPCNLIIRYSSPNNILGKRSPYNSRKTWIIYRRDLVICLQNLKWKDSLVVRWNDLKSIRSMKRYKYIEKKIRRVALTILKIYQ